MKLLNKYNQLSPNQEKNSAMLQHCVTATLIATLSVLLSGCMGIYEGGFECPAGTGVGCKSISEVNAMVNLGELPKSDTTISLEAKENGHACSSCGHSSSLTQDKPEIWINPLYLKSLRKKHQEAPQEEGQDIKRQKVLDDTIFL